MNYLTKLNKIESELKLPNFSSRVLTINRLVQLLDQQDIPKTNLPDFEIMPDEVELLFKTVDKTKHQLLQSGLNLLSNFRQFLSLHYGLWSLANVETCRLIKNHFDLKTGLEVMAGNAMWSSGFDAVGVKMIATDDLSWGKTSTTGTRQFTEVVDLSALDAIEKYHNQVDFIFFSWAPNFGIDDLKLLEYIRTLSHPPLILMVGEIDGATNSPQFWQEARLTRHITTEISNSFQSFDFIEEELILIE